MTEAVQAPSRTITIPVGSSPTPCEVPTRDATLMVRYVVTALAAKRAGARGILHIPFPQPYLRQIVTARAAALASGGAERTKEMTQMANKMAEWGRHQTPTGPALDDICAAMTSGQLLDPRGGIRAFVERDSCAADLIFALLGHAPDCGNAACGICAAARCGRWDEVLNLTETPPATIRDAYVLALDCGWLPRLPDAQRQVQRRLTFIANPTAEAYIDPFDL